MEMFVFSSREIVQLALVLTVALMNRLCFARDTSAKTSSSMPMMVQPIRQVFRCDSGASTYAMRERPWLASSLARVIEKHVACAAGISS